MKCLKTGARVWIQELSAVFPADVYAVGDDVLVVRFNQLGREVAWNKEGAVELGATYFVKQPPEWGEDWVRGDIGVAVCLRCNFEGELIE